jgi:CYTH domain-containing protein/predicted ATPase
MKVYNPQLIKPVHMIVLTGGPCSGKSSSLAYLTERLSDHGFMVFVIPETATLISTNGIDRRKMDRARQVVMYEEAILDMQLSFEETYVKAINRIFPERKKVILLDRGVMDIKAFISKDDFRQMLKRKGLKEVSLRDRYHGVIHLVTAAQGAAEHYTAENNGARIETPEEAVRIDRNVRESWLGHPHFKVIDSRPDFDDKIRRTFEAIAQFLGIPASAAVKERFVVGEVLYDQLPAHQTVEIEQVYLRSKDREEEISIRKRGQDDSYLYFLRRTRKSPGAATEEELIDEQQFENLRKLIDPKTEVLLKHRVCFLWNNRLFELDRYRGAHEGLCVLGVEPADADVGAAGPEVPPFIKIEKNITTNARYSERNLATRRKARD